MSRAVRGSDAATFKSRRPMSFGLQQPFSVPFGSTYPSVVVPIDGIFNNHAASKNGAIADFDGHGSSFDAQFLPHGSWVYDGITVSRHIVHLFYPVLMSTS